MSQTTFAFLSKEKVPDPKQLTHAEIFETVESPSLRSFLLPLPLSSPEAPTHEGLHLGVIIHHYQFGVK